MLSEYIKSLADVSFHIVASMYVRPRYSGKNPMRFAVFWHISVRFCGFRTPLTPPSTSMKRRKMLLSCLSFFIFSCEVSSKLMYVLWKRGNEIHRKIRENTEPSENCASCGSWLIFLHVLTQSASLCQISLWPLYNNRSRPRSFVLPRIHKPTKFTKFLAPTVLVRACYVPGRAFKTRRKEHIRNVKTAVKPAPELRTMRGPLNILLTLTTPP